MGSKVVHHDNVTKIQGRRQALLNPAAKDQRVHWPVDYHRGLHTAKANGAEHGGGMPVAMRPMLDHPYAARGPAVQTNHVRLGPGFVEEHELFEVDAPQTPIPKTTFDSYVRPLLLRGMQ